MIASPAVVFFLLRLRPMSPPDLPDPAMHTAYLVDPHDVFTRYSTVYVCPRNGHVEYPIGGMTPPR